MTDKSDNKTLYIYQNEVLSRVKEMLPLIYVNIPYNGLIFKYNISDELF